MRAVYLPRVSSHFVRLALGYGLLGFQPELAMRVFKVDKVFKFIRDCTVLKT